MRSTTELVGNVAVLTILEPRLDAARGAELRSVIANVVAEGHHMIVLDISAVKFIDSTGLGAIVSAYKLVDRSGKVALCGAADPVLTLFRLTRMDKVFAFFPSRSEAIQSIGANACNLS